eukprot:6357781-Pyramimonas_sp.AAC.1
MGMFSLPLRDWCPLWVYSLSDSGWTSARLCAQLRDVPAGVLLRLLPGAAPGQEPGPGRLQAVHRGAWDGRSDRPLHPVQRLRQGQGTHPGTDPRRRLRG